MTFAGISRVSFSFLAIFCCVAAFHYDFARMITIDYDASRATAFSLYWPGDTRCRSSRRLKRDTSIAVRINTIRRALLSRVIDEVLIGNCDGR